MAEMLQCPNCKQYINLEINIRRDYAGNIYCPYCQFPIRKDN